MFLLQVVKNTLKPTWKPFKIDLKTLCNADYDKRIKVMHWDIFSLMHFIIGITSLLYVIDLSIKKNLSLPQSDTH